MKLFVHHNRIRIHALSSSRRWRYNPEMTMTLLMIHDEGSAELIAKMEAEG